MAYVKGEVVKLPSVFKDIPPNPQFGYDSPHTAPPSTVESLEAATQSTLKHRLLLYDQLCLVTGGISTRLQVCHLVKPIRTNDSNRKIKEPLKELVEYILTRQQFGSGKFSFDSLPNCVTLGVEHRMDLDTYGTFCITVPLQQVVAIVEELRKSNRDWERRANSDPQASRDLNIKEDPFVVRRCVLLVLYPSLFLHNNHPLDINTRRVLRDPGGDPLTESEAPIWTDHYPQYDQPYLVNTSDQEFTEFDYVSKRHQDQNPSIFSLLVNANSQLQGVKQRAKQQSDYLPGVRTYINLVEDAVKAIFFVPRGLQKKPPLLGLPVPSYSSGQHPSPIIPGPSTKFHGGLDDLEGQNSSGVVEEERSDSNVEPEGHDYDYNSEGVDGPDTINGLTFSEMETILQRVSDGTISGEERAEAAMLMLGMTGHRRPLVVSLLLKDYV